MIQPAGGFVNDGFWQKEKILPSAPREAERGLGRGVWEEKFIFPNFGAFFSGNAGHFELVVLL
ncbi:hypothetical protein [uncultured Intestinimonas sp.]|nr:hypothetical protein [uncultured Intestinimonas sp.]